MENGVIEIDIRRKAFGPTVVLRDIRLRIAPADRVAIVGPSGIGKSTLLRIIAGTDTDYDGSVQRPERQAIVFQEPTLLRWRSVLRNLTLLNHGLSDADAMAMLARVGLDHRAADFPGQLSLGQQRRVALARAFARRPDLLILDEPFVSLDETTAEEIISLTESLVAELHPTMIFVTHSRTEAERLADRIVRLSGTPATIEA